MDRVGFISDGKSSTILIWLLLFPYVGFFNGIDTQPIFIVLATCLVPFYLGRIRFSKFEVAYFFLCCAVLAFSFIIQSSQLSIVYVVTYLVVIFNICIIKKYVDHGIIRVENKHIVVATVIYILIGVVQLYYPSFLTGLVSRSSESVLYFSETGRGVRSLAAEPATLGKIFNYFYVIIIVISFKHDGFNFRRFLLITMCFFLAHIIIPRSAYAISIYMAIVSGLILFINKRFFVVSIILLSFLLYILLNSTSNVYDGRIVQILRILFESPDLLLQQGAMRRLLNIPISIHNLTYFGMFGSGSSLEVFDSILPTPIGGLNYVAHSRNLGGVVEMILVLGVLSLPFLIMYFRYIFSCRVFWVDYGERRINIGWWLVFSLMVLTFQDGAITLPLCWFIIFFFSKLANYRPKNKIQVL